MNQPVWEMAGELPASEDEILTVYRDATGVYPPELDRLAKYYWVPCAERHRVVLEPCTYAGGILSDNPHHPSRRVWFAATVEAIARTNGIAADELREMLTSDDAMALGEGYRMILDYHGWDNGDGYPRHYTREELSQVMPAQELGRFWPEEECAE